MNRMELEQYITLTYCADGEHPWEKYPEYTVFRHTANRKWFALLVTIPADKLDGRKSGMVDVLNVKCSPSVIAELAGEEPGFYPAYHMNKKNWISIVIDGTVSEAKLRWMLDKSFALTAPKIKKAKPVEPVEDEAAGVQEPRNNK